MSSSIVLFIQVTKFKVIAKLFFFLSHNMQVPSGEYRLSALPVDSKGSSSLLFSPGHIDVNVKGPLLDVEFSQVNECLFTHSRDFSTLFIFHQI